MADTPQYHRPTELDSALDALASGQVTLAAGCTDLFPATERKILPGSILDITAIEALRGIKRDDTGITIGATTTWSEVIAADLPPSFDALKLAAREVGGRQIQNQGTVAGNLCNASPAADGVPPLLILNATVRLASANATREVALREFIQGPRDTSCQSDEIVTAIHVPTNSLRGNSHFLKLGARHSLVISIAMTAARVQIEGGLVTAAALAIGACGPVACRVGMAERALIGGPLDPDAITDAMVADAISPIDDHRADAAYRTRAAAELLRRTIRAIGSAS